jgi:dynein heavy chain, axonemal
MMDVSIPMKIVNTLSLVNGILKGVPIGSKITDLEYERIVVFSLAWSIGGLFEAAERVQFHEYLQSKNCPLPQNKKESETIFDYYIVIQDQKVEYAVVKPEIWKPSADKGFKFSQLLLPTLDSFRVEYLVNNVLTQPRPTHSSTAFVQNGVLLIGGSGTAKTSSVLMWALKFDPAVQLFKRINFSSATSPGLFQASIEQECDNKMGKEYGPPQNKLLAIFVDDLSMPFVNKWGDQVTL